MIVHRTLEPDVRDQFAIQLATAMLQFGGTNGRDPVYIARKAYDIADEMLAERERRTSPAKKPFEYNALIGGTK